MSNVRRIVVKVGSTTIADDGHLNEAALDGLVHDLALVKQEGVEVYPRHVGSNRRGLATTRSKATSADATALTSLCRCWSDLVDGGVRGAVSVTMDNGTALMLLTRDDFSNRERYTRMNDTLRALLHHGVVPIINENDTVAVDEIKVGDNDTLSAYVTNLAQAELLVVLSDQAGFYTADPRHSF